MNVRFCDGCGEVISPTTRAARDLVIPEGAPEGRPVDWCLGCIAIIRAELPRLAKEARAARHTLREGQTLRASTVDRAMWLWDRTELYPHGRGFRG